MRKIFFFIGVLFLFSCTSNTIFKEPEDLIPKDTMVHLMKDMIIASSSSYFKNKNFEKQVNYMPLVYEKYKIDSGRFQRSNLYYMSKIDDYKNIVEEVKKSIEEEKEYLTNLKTKQDSIRKDSINKVTQRRYQIKDSLNDFLPKEDFKQKSTKLKRKKIENKRTINDKDSILKIEKSIKSKN